MKIYVCNIPYDTDDETLRSVFAGYGKVDSADIVKDRMGRSRGFGFVNMPDPDEAMAAIEAVDGSDIGGRTVSAREAISKPDNGHHNGHRRHGRFDRFDRMDRMDRKRMKGGKPWNRQGKGHGFSQDDDKW